MDITTRNIEQCDAVSVLNAIMDSFVQNPVNRAMTKMDEVKTTTQALSVQVQRIADQFDGITKADIEAELNENTTQS